MVDDSWKETVVTLCLPFFLCLIFALGILQLSCGYYRRVDLDLCLALMSFSNDGSFMRYTCCDRKPLCIELTRPTILTSLLVHVQLRHAGNLF
jgi:hypothetical protein